MNSQPLVSVVMGVYNGERELSATLDSIFSQQGVEFECIVVDDGSSDTTRSILEQRSTHEPRLKIHRLPRSGLTKALITGCAVAQGNYIARIDAGDRLLPLRLVKQFESLESNPDVGLVSCGTRFMSAEGEWLYSISQQANELSLGLDSCDMKTVCGPSHHGSTMFRRSLYEALGGYREVFTVAQDLDLWKRLHEVSSVLAMPEILYESRMFPDSISVRRRALQLAVAALILEGARCRRAGLPEPDYRALMPEREEQSPGASRYEMARYDYFVGGCLSKIDTRAAARHFGRAWRQSPINIKYGLQYLRSLIQ